MTNPAHHGRMLFVNIPVTDLERSKAFFAKLGFSYNAMFTDESAACMLVGIAPAAVHSKKILTEQAPIASHQAACRPFASTPNRDYGWRTQIPRRSRKASPSPRSPRP